MGRPVVSLSGIMKHERRYILILTAGVFTAWLLRTVPEMLAVQHGLLRFTLGISFALLILFRKKKSSVRFAIPAYALGAMAMLAAVISLAGRIFDLGQAEWLGLILLLTAAAMYALPANWGPDILRSVFLLYWVHPLPGQLFGAIETFLQRISVAGTEILLHSINERIWADGFSLYTGLAVFEVPVYCSGMRSATTVFLLAWGMAILLRLPLLWAGAFCAAAVLQALFLNILRICAVIILAPGFAEGAAQAMLHDSSGVLLITAVLLTGWEVRLTALAYRNRQQHLESINPHRMKHVTPHPPFWRSLLHHWRGLIVMLVVLLLISGVVWRQRKSHRIAMWRDVANGFIESGQLEKAERLGQIIMEAYPDNKEWALQIVRVYIQRAKYEQALTVLDRYDFGHADDEQRILRGYTLMWMDRLQEAAEMIAGIPEQKKNSDPRVAMIMAEMGFFFDNPAQVEQFVPVATAYPPNLFRIRALYPYMRRNRQWAAMVRSASPQPYRDPVPALALLEAYMTLNRTADVADLVVEMLNTWPEEPRLIEPLFFLALKRINTPWETTFSTHLNTIRNKIHDPDILYSLLPRCFDLGRPDLAWLILLRIQELDRDHPYLPMSVSHFGKVWFRVRSTYIGLPSASNFATTDIAPLLRMSGVFSPGQPLLKMIPYGRDVIYAEDITLLSREMNDTALKLFAQRNAEQQLSVDAAYEYVTALERAGRQADAVEILRNLAEENPGQAMRSRIKTAGIYERSGDWQNVYEALRTYPELPVRDRTTAAMSLLLRAQTELQLNLAAWHTARRMQREFPGTVRTAYYTSMILLQLKRPAEALNIINQPRPRNSRTLELLKAQALLANERFLEMEELCRSLLVPALPVPASTVQRERPLPAEYSVMWPHYGIPASSEFKDNAAVLRENRQQAVSPFMTALMDLWLRCFDSVPKSDDKTERVWLPEVWLSVARDPLEAATVLHQLILLQCYAGRLDTARETVAIAVEKLPDMPLLWEMYIGLSASDTNLTARARQACPDAPELWLADLVTRSRAYIDAGLQAEEIDEIIAAGIEDSCFDMPPETIARAADFLLRGGLIKSAAPAAWIAAGGAPSSLSAQMTALRCAVRLNDRDKATQYSRRAISAARQPSAQLYESLARLRVKDGSLPLDGDMLEAVKHLVQTDPENPYWIKMLGYMRYKRGGWETVDTGTLMLDAIERGIDDPLLYLLGAEASRLSGNQQRAVDLLRSATDKYPENDELYNNLVYTLAQQAESLEEAYGMLDKLLQEQGDNPHALDTVATVYMQKREFSNALPILDRIDKLVEQKSPLAFRAKVMRARIYLESERVAEAEQMVSEALQFSRFADQQDLLKAASLKNEVDIILQAEKKEQNK